MKKSMKIHYVLYKPPNSIWIKIQAMKNNNKKQQLKDQCSQVGFNELLEFIYDVLCEQFRFGFNSGMPFSIHVPTLIEFYVVDNGS